MPRHASSMACLQGLEGEVSALQQRCATLQQQAQQAADAAAAAEAQVATARREAREAAAQAQLQVSERWQPSLSVL